MPTFIMVRVTPVTLVTPPHPVTPLVVVLFLVLVLIVVAAAAGLLQMIIRVGRPFANDHLEEPAFCK